MRRERGMVRGMALVAVAVVTVAGLVGCGSDDGGRSGVPARDRDDAADAPDASDGGDDERLDEGDDLRGGGDPTACPYVTDDEVTEAVGRPMVGDDVSTIDDYTNCTWLDLDEDAVSIMLVVQPIVDGLSLSDAPEPIAGLGDEGWWDRGRVYAVVDDWYALAWVQGMADPERRAAGEAIVRRVIDRM